MPIPRGDLALRREVLVLFELCGVDPSSIVFADELDLDALQVRDTYDERVCVEVNLEICARFSSAGKAQSTKARSSLPGVVALEVLERLFFSTTCMFVDPLVRWS